MGDWAPLDAGASLVNGIINMFSARNNNKRQIQAAKDMQLEQERFSKEMFDLENAYNTPSAQRDRMIDAQINPAVAWASGLSADTGNGAGNGSISPVMPTTEAIPSPLQGMVGTKPFEALNSYMQAKKTASETAKNQKEYDLLIKEIEEKDYDIAYAQTRNYMQSIESAYKDKKEYNETMILIHRASNLIEEGNNLKLQGKLLQAEEEFKKAQKLLTDKEISKLGIEIDYLPQMLASKIREQNASAAQSYASANQMNELTPILKNINKAEFNKILRDIRGADIKNRNDAIDVLRKTLNVDENAVNNLVRRFDNKVHKGLYDYTARGMADFFTDTYIDELGYDK